MRYVWRDGEWRNRDTGEVMTTSGRPIGRVQVISDTPEYFSVASGKMVDGRAARREDLKRTGCREVDPSEGPKFCRSEKWARRLGLEHNPDAGRPKHWVKDFSSKRQ